jgi:hypothetical protein
MACTNNSQSWPRCWCWCATTSSGSRNNNCAVSIRCTVLGRDYYIQLLLNKDSSYSLFSGSFSISHGADAKRKRACRKAGYNGKSRGEKGGRRRVRGARMSWAGQASYRAASKNRVACEACGAMPPWPVMVIKSDARKGKRLGGVEYGITMDMQKWHITVDMQKWHRRRARECRTKVVRG